MTQLQAYLNGRFLPAAELSLSIHDLGFTFGATVSERFRTFGGRLFRAAEHLGRLARSLEIVGLTSKIDLGELAHVAETLVAKNHALLASDDDLGATLLITPGLETAIAGRTPTVCLYTTPLPFGQWADLYESGQRLATTDIRQIPAVCWPPDLKCRSRMHYYLADRAAAQNQPGARAILLDGDGFINEASTANVVVYRKDEGLISPPLERILHGISLETTFELAAAAGVACSHRQLTVGETAAADEVMLTSTSPCIVPVASLDGRPIGDGAPGPMFRRLLAAWSDYVGLDVAGQARRYSQRLAVN